MKTFVEPDSKQLEQCIFPQMFIRYRLYFRGEGGLGNFQKKNPAQQKLTKYREREPQGASTIIILFFLRLKKKLAQAIAHQKKFVLNRNVREKNVVSQKIPNPYLPLRRK